MSLNGAELLTDTGQTLSSCGIVSGDLICVTLPESAAASATNTTTNKNEASMPSSSTEVQRTEPGPQTAVMATNQVSDGNILQQWRKREQVHAAATVLCEVKTVVELPVGLSRFSAESWFCEVAAS